MFRKISALITFAFVCLFSPAYAGTSGNSSSGAWVLQSTTTVSGSPTLLTIAIPAGANDVLFVINNVTVGAGAQFSYSFDNSNFVSVGNSNLTAASGGVTLFGAKFSPTYSTGCVGPSAGVCSVITLGSQQPGSGWASTVSNGYFKFGGGAMTGGTILEYVR